MQTRSQPNPDSKLGCLINFLEIWQLNQPDDEDSKPALQLETSLAIANGNFRHLESDRKEISKGEGIVGSAWQQEGPVILQGASAELEQVAQRTGLPTSSLLAIPIFDDFTLVNILILGFAPGHGGMEIWTRDDRDELGISGSYYDGLPSFDFISQYVRFPKGAGLPGYCWKYSRPKIIENPGVDPAFIRSFDRDPAKLGLCLGLPISREYGFPASILLLLSNAEAPLARGIDVWQTDSEKPNESEPLPAINFKKSQSTEIEFTSEFHQFVCEEVANNRSTVFISMDSNKLPQDSQFIVAVPFFSKRKIEDVLILTF